MERLTHKSANDEVITFFGGQFGPLKNKLLERNRLTGKSEGGEGYLFEGGDTLLFCIC